MLLADSSAVEFDTVVAASGVLDVLPRVQRLRLAAEHAGRLAHVWADEHSVHVLIGGEHVRTSASNLTSADLEDLRLRGARPAGPPPVAAVAARSSKLPAGTVVEVTRAVDAAGFCQLDGALSTSGRPWPSSKWHSALTGTSSTLSPTACSPRPCRRRSLRSDESTFEAPASRTIRCPHLPPA
ncbi:hypothetical protein [Streptomyces sp. NPDC008137]|uniref:hypothetical protein n=1 Tax=Streptomyces sp. NPDC008137 TaxID=3364813 RepID=UPI0036EA89BB